MIGPMPSTASSSSSGAAARAPYVRKRRARTRAATGPTWRIPSPTRTRDEWRGLRAIDLAHERRGRDLGESLEGLDVGDPQREEVRDVSDESGEEQLGDALLAESLDVERAARGEVHDLLELLGGTRRIHAVGVALGAATHERLTALGTVRAETSTSCHAASPVRAPR